MREVSIGNILKNMRNTNTNYTQKEMGEKMSIADNTISSYERENSQPDFQTIVNYADICDFEIKMYNKKTNEEVTLEELSKEL
ncbi:MAG: helix-turn-helix transcriptional regulator [Clostridia bacterium]|nr:helix-turn-helix transcriptional regulator [Clostridia bacterium]